MAKTLIRLDKVQAYEAGNLTNIVHDADLENGRVVVLRGETKVDGVFEAETPDAVDIIADEILLHASAEVLYDPSIGIDDFVLKTGKVGRAIHLTIGDQITVTQDAIDGVIAEGKYVIPKANQTQLAIADDLTGGTTLAFKLVDKDVKLGVNRSACTLRVVKNGILDVESPLAEILTFSLPDKTGDAVINSQAGTIDIEVEHGTVLTSLVATFTTSPRITSIKVGATAQTSGITANNFTNPVKYDVLAENGLTKKTWTVTVTVAEE